jgi:hypothetical protein
MRSYPNLIPLSGRVVERIGSAVAELTFDRVYGAFWDGVIAKDAKNSVARSVQRYLQALALEA